MLTKLTKILYTKTACEKSLNLLKCKCIVTYAGNSEENMKKFKDFIYDKNDIIIAVLILAVAALVIFWRLNIILEYPKQLLGTDDTGIETPVDGGNEADDSGDNTDGDDIDDNTDDNSTQDVPLWQGGVLTKDVEVEVTGNSASAAIQCLIDKGLFDDYDEYKKICDDNGMDHEKVKAGTFTFQKGSTKKEIAKKMNWG